MSIHQLMAKGRGDISDIDAILARAERVAEDTRQTGIQVDMCVQFSVCVRVCAYGGSKCVEGVEKKDRKGCMPD